MSIFDSVFISLFNKDILSLVNMNGVLTGCSGNQPLLAGLIKEIRGDVEGEEQRLA